MAADERWSEHRRLAPHTAMSSQALESERVRDGLRDVLLNHAGLYEALGEAASIR